LISLGGREWHYWALVTNDLERSADELESWHRAKANLENKIKEAKLGLGLDNLPCASFHANWSYLLITLLAYNLLAWLKLLALPDRERQSYAKRLRFRFIAVAGTVGRSGRRLILRLSAGYSLFAEFVRALEKHPRPRARTHLKPQPPPQPSRSRSTRAKPSPLPATRCASTPTLGQNRSPRP
jgi:hypothetical protein